MLLFAFVEVTMKYRPRPCLEEGYFMFADGLKCASLKAENSRFGVFFA
jgi:hypothetical protein